MKEIIQPITRNVQNLYTTGSNMKIVKKICNFLSGRTDRLSALQEARTIVGLIKSGDFSFEEATLLCDLAQAEETIKFIIKIKERSLSYESALIILDKLINELEEEMA